MVDRRHWLKTTFSEQTRFSDERCVPDSLKVAMAQNSIIGDNVVGNNGDIQGGGAGPFGVGNTPGVFSGEVANGGPEILGPQYPQHGSGAVVR